MLLTAWLFIGAIATLITGVAVSTKTQAAALYGNDDGVAIIAGIAGFISWGYLAYGALNLEIVTNSGTVVQQSMPFVPYFCVMMALVPGFIALTGPTDIIRRARRPDADEL